MDRYPNLGAAANEARRTDPDEEFRRGLAILLRGLAAELRPGGPSI